MSDNCNTIQQQSLSLSDPAPIVAPVVEGANGAQISASASASAATTAIAPITTSCTARLQNESKKKYRVTPTHSQMTTNTASFIDHSQQRQQQILRDTTATTTNTTDTSTLSNMMQSTSNNSSIETSRRKSWRRQQQQQQQHEDTTPPGPIPNGTISGSPDTNQQQQHAIPLSSIGSIGGGGFSGGEDDAISTTVMTVTTTADDITDDDDDDDDNDGEIDCSVVTNELHQHQHQQQQQQTTTRCVGISKSDGKITGRSMVSLRHHNHRHHRYSTTTTNPPQSTASATTIQADTNQQQQQQQQQRHQTISKKKVNHQSDHDGDDDDSDFDCDSSDASDNVSDLDTTDANDLSKRPDDHCNNNNNNNNQDQDPTTDANNNTTTTITIGSSQRSSIAGDYEEDPTLLLDYSNQTTPPPLTSTNQNQNQNLNQQQYRHYQVQIGEHPTIAPNSDAVVGCSTYSHSMFYPSSSSVRGYNPYNSHHTFVGAPQQQASSSDISRQYASSSNSHVQYLPSQQSQGRCDANDVTIATNNNNMTMLRLLPTTTRLQQPVSNGHQIIMSQLDASQLQFQQQQQQQQQATSSINSIGASGARDLGAPRQQPQPHRYVHHMQENLPTLQQQQQLSSNNNVIINSDTSALFASSNVSNLYPSSNVSSNNIISNNNNSASTSFWPTSMVAPPQCDDYITASSHHHQQRIQPQHLYQQQRQQQQQQLQFPPPPYSASSTATPLDNNYGYRNNNAAAAAAPPSTSTVTTVTNQTNVRQQQPTSNNSQIPLQVPLSNNNNNKNDNNSFNKYNQQQQHQNNNNTDSNNHHIKSSARSRHRPRSTSSHHRTNHIGLNQNQGNTSNTLGSTKYDDSVRTEYLPTKTHMQDYTRNSRKAKYHQQTESRQWRPSLEGATGRGRNPSQLSASKSLHHLHYHRASSLQHQQHQQHQQQQEQQQQAQLINNQSEAPSFSIRRSRTTRQKSRLDSTDNGNNRGRRQDRLGQKVALRSAKSAQTLANNMPTTGMSPQGDSNVCFSTLQRLPSSSSSNHYNDDGDDDEDSPARDFARIARRTMSVSHPLASDPPIGATGVGLIRAENNNRIKSAPTCGETETSEETGVLLNSSLLTTGSTSAACPHDHQSKGRLACRLNQLMSQSLSCCCSICNWLPFITTTTTPGTSIKQQQQQQQQNNQPNELSMTTTFESLTSQAATAVIPPVSNQTKPPVVVTGSSVGSSVSYGGSMAASSASSSSAYASGSSSTPSSGSKLKQLIQVCKQPQIKSMTLTKTTNNVIPLKIQSTISSFVCLNSNNNYPTTTQSGDSSNFTNYYNEQIDDAIDEQQQQQQHNIITNSQQQQQLPQLNKTSNIISVASTAAKASTRGYIDLRQDQMRGDFQTYIRSNHHHTATIGVEIPRGTICDNMCHYFCWFCCFCGFCNVMPAQQLPKICRLYPCRQWMKFKLFNSLLLGRLVSLIIIFLLFLLLFIAGHSLYVNHFTTTSRTQSSLQHYRNNYRYIGQKNNIFSSNHHHLGGQYHHHHSYPTQTTTILTMPPPPNETHLSFFVDAPIFAILLLHNLKLALKLSPPLSIIASSTPTTATSDSNIVATLQFGQIRLTQAMVRSRNNLVRIQDTLMELDKCQRDIVPINININVSNTSSSIPLTSGKNTTSKFCHLLLERAHQMKLHLRATASEVDGAPDPSQLSDLGLLGDHSEETEISSNSDRSQAALESSDAVNSNQLHHHQQALAFASYLEDNFALIQPNLIRHIIEANELPDNAYEEDAPEVASKTNKVIESILANNIEQQQDRTLNPNANPNANLNQDGTSGADIAHDEDYIYPWVSYRLPKFIQPVSYDLFMYPNLTTKFNWGLVKIVLHLLKDSNFIVIHSDQLNIADIQFTITTTTSNSPQEAPGSRESREEDKLNENNNNGNNNNGSYLHQLNYNQTTTQQNPTSSSLTTLIPRLIPIRRVLTSRKYQQIYIEFEELLLSVSDIHHIPQQDNEQINGIRGAASSLYNNYTLKITFNKTINQENNFNQGIYIINYRDYTQSDEQKQMLATQFEPIYARSAFPCFDEPHLKATFQLNLVHDSSHSVYFNSIKREKVPYSSDGLVMSAFEPTPIPISTYLVAWVICDFKPLISRTSAAAANTPHHHLNLTNNNNYPLPQYHHQDSSSSNHPRVVQIQVLSAPDQLGQAEFASTLAPQLLDYYQRLFKMNYPMDKLDLVAIPEFLAGGMENFGLIMFKSQLILIDQYLSSNELIEQVAVLLAHELAHQWFGNIVTMRWWNELWLNEGFATYMENVAIQQIYPDWRMLEQFVIHTIQPALMLDMYESSTHPVYKPLTSVRGQQQDIETMFDPISYKKGASLIYMIKSLISHDEIREIMCQYLHQYQYKTATSADFWQIVNQVVVETSKTEHYNHGYQGKQQQQQFRPNKLRSAAETETSAHSEMNIVIDADNLMMQNTNNNEANIDFADSYPQQPDQLSSTDYTQIRNQRERPNTDQYQNPNHRPASGRHDTNNHEQDDIIDLRSVMSTWIYETGHPIITASIYRDRIILRQQRFYINEPKTSGILSHHQTRRGALQPDDLVDRYKEANKVPAISKDNPIRWEASLTKDNNNRDKIPRVVDPEMLKLNQSNPSEMPKTSDHGIIRVASNGTKMLSASLFASSQFVKNSSSIPIDNLKNSTAQSMDESAIDIISTASAGQISNFDSAKLRDQRSTDTNDLLIRGEDTSNIPSDATFEADQHGQRMIMGSQQNQQYSSNIDIKNHNPDPIWTIPITYITNWNSRQAKFVWMRSREMVIPISSVQSAIVGGLDRENYNTHLSSGPHQLMSPMGSSVSHPLGSQWFKLNVNQTGFYRVNYDERIWESLIRLLMNSHYSNHVLSATDRANLLDDSMVLMRSGRLSVGIAMNMTLYLEIGERDYIPWASALRHFEHLSILMNGNPTWHRYVLRLINPVISVIGWKDDGPHLMKKLRTLLFKVALLYGDEKIIQKAKNEFKTWFKSNRFIVPNLQEIVYTAGVRFGEQQEWYHCWNKYQQLVQQSSTQSIVSHHQTTLGSSLSSSNGDGRASRSPSPDPISSKPPLLTGGSNSGSQPYEQRLLLSALGSTQNTWLLEQFLNYSLDATKIRPQELIHVMTVLGRNPVARLYMWRFIRLNWSLIVDRFSRSNFIIDTIIIESTKHLSTQLDYEEVETFFQQQYQKQSRQSSSSSSSSSLPSGIMPGSSAVEQSLEMIKSNIYWRVHIEPRLTRWLSQYEAMNRMNK